MWRPGMWCSDASFKGSADLQSLLKNRLVNLLACFGISVAFLLGTVGCGTFQKESASAHQSFFSGDFAKAAELLDAKSKEEGRDQLLFLFDRAMALQLAGDYATSAKIFNQADIMSDVKDYTSLSAETASLFINDWALQYKGEDFEKVLINVFQAIDYAVAGDLDNAMVECRRVNNKLLRYKDEAKRDYEQNPFARYLAALIRENAGDIDSAYIEYKQTANLDPDFPYVKYDVVRLSKRLGRDEDYKRWIKKYGELETTTVKEEKETGEVVLIFQQGRSAEKVPRPEAPKFPMFVAHPTNTQAAQIATLDGKYSEKSQRLYSVSEIAIKTLNDAYGKLVAKRVAGIVAKEVIADQIRQKDKLLGDLTWIAMHVVDQADTRYWATLPETLQIARLRLPPGDYSFKVTGLNSAGAASGEERLLQNVKVEKRKKVFLTWRSLN